MMNTPIEVLFSINSYSALHNVYQLNDKSLILITNDYADDSYGNKCYALDKPYYVLKNINANELLYSKLNSYNTKFLEDGEIIKESKIFFYDNVFNHAQKLITEFIKSKKILDFIGDKDEYLSELNTIDLDLKHKTVCFFGCSAYFHNITEAPIFDIQEMYKILDINKLIAVLTHISGKPINNIKIITSGFINMKRFYYHPIVMRINNEFSLYTYDVFSDAFWNGDFKKFIK